MASLRKESDRGRTGWRLQFRQSGKRRSLWLGAMSKRAAEGVARHVEELVRASAANVQPEAEAAKWARGVDERIHKSLVKWGLTSPRVVVAEEDRYAGSFFERLITEKWEGLTARNYRQGASSFTERFGADRLLSTITPVEFGQWHQWMRKQGLAEATANKRAKMVRTMLKEAVRRKIIDENPGSDTKIGGEVNRDRDHYITREDAGKILAKCDTEWALLFGLCRFAGLRCPTEVTGLKWSDVQWDDSRLRIDSQKTGLRFTPIFPEIKPLLDAAWDAAPEGSTYVISRYRDREANLRTQMHRITESAGLAAWQKTFVNLRASCRTDLQDRFPDHCVNTWLGHSSRVAERHYLQTTDAHWQRAIEEPVGGVIGGVISADLRESGAPSEADDTEKTLCLAGADDSQGETRHAQVDSNHRPTD
ncbi:tyrosine-type recombinase/integrase [Rhodopirellula sallentina]|uniref:Integrase family protein n=1 Tax=Rhodopirellula sallentina SM41 TaxID=1263870 RepID=M5TU20_9BACT|nr:integrase family protein [Rhodopirellula sallentina SM41]